MSETSIHEACQRGDLEAVRALIAVDPKRVDSDDQYEWRPIFHAALRRHEEIVRLLIDAGADLSAHDGYVLHYAAEVPDNKAVVTLLVQYGALDAHVRPTSDLSRQLLAAIFLGDTSRVQSLLRMHPELATEPDGRGDQPIHHAARNGDTEIVKVLHEYGADVNVRTKNGQTVLYCAGGHGHVETVQLLLDRDADCDARFTDDGVTLLEWLAQYPDDTRFVDVAAALTRHKAGR